MLILFAFSFLFKSCVGSVYDEKLNGGYYLSALDLKEDMSIGFQDSIYGIGIIEPTVFSVGQNKDFIIAKQHPIVNNQMPNKSVINYFIIPLSYKISKSIDSNFYGPLSLIDFEVKRKELGISNLKFAIQFPELE